MIKSKITILLLTMLAVSCKYKEIEEHRGLTTCKIVDYSNGYRGGISLEYLYVVNNIEYKGSSSQMLSAKYWDDYKDKYFPVVYSTINPEKSIILVYPKDFIQWGYVFPDSLDWVIDKHGF
jgi:hypothetical protein